MNVLFRVKEVEWRGIVAAAAAWIFAVFVVNAVAVRGVVGEALRGLHAVTGGLVEPTLVGSAAVLFIFMITVVAIGRTPLASIGWAPQDAVRSLLPVIGFWLLMQGTLTLIAVASGSPLTLHPSWRDVGAGALIGGVLAQVLGNALAEETAFRGFFFTQFLLKTQALRPAASFGVAALASALLFAASHIPNRVFVKGLPMESLVVDQAQLIFAGVVFALVFMATRNVFTTAGLHAFANDPAPLVATTEEVVQVTYLALLFAMVLGFVMMKKLRQFGH